jgi:protein-disulfide isomerase
MSEYDGKVRLIFRDFPLPSHRLAHGAHEASRCAGSMGQYWSYHDRLFQNQPQFDRGQLVQYAVDVGLDATAFKACLDEHRFAAAVDKDVTDGKAMGVKGTPTFFINDQPFVGAHPFESFRTMIDAALREKR